MDTTSDDAAAAREAPEKPRADPDVDVWWGSYWGWAMLPSWMVSAVLAAALAVLAWLVMRDTGYGHLVVLVLVGGVGLLQLLRWAERFFGRNYRLTNRQLLIERGVFRPAVL